LKAIHYLKIAIAEEKSATAMFNLAIIYEEQGERGKAKEMYQEVSHRNDFIDQFKHSFFEEISKLNC